MRKRTKIFIGITAVFFVLLVSLFFFFRFQIQKSYPQTTGTIEVSGLIQSVSIARDEFGVPHIGAENDHDLMMAWGFVHAQGRMWQMDVGRRAGMGRLSEIFGSVTIEFDKMFRIIGIQHIAETVAGHLDSASAGRLQWYADGVNAYITLAKGRYPVEFDMLGYEPEPWTPVHSIIIGRLMSWQLNMSWWVDLTLGGIADRVGYDKAIELFPPYPGNVPPIVSRSALKAIASDGTEWLNIARQYNQFNGNEGMSAGSNAWVVAPQKSSSSKVILANDTHLQLHAPSNWYEVHISSHDLNVSGMSVPGIPGVVSGHNDHVAWGVTAVMADDADYYIEQLDSVDQLTYLYDGKWLSVKVRDEEISVRGDSTVKFIVRSTHHGPVVTDIHTRLQKGHLPFVATMRWTGAERDNQIDAFYKINRATNWNEFLVGVREFPGPGQNFVYGDVHGNIGYWCGVKLPLRAGVNSTMPLPGWTKETEWKGFVPFEKLPHLFNPSEGYIATANNKIVDDSYPYLISNLWEPPARILRLREFLGKQDVFSPDDFSRLQNDTYSSQARATTPFLLAVLRKTDLPEKEKLLEYFENWNFHFDENDIATLIFQEFYTRLLANTYKDEMGEELFHDFVILVNIPVRVMSKMLEEDSTAWFDDVTTSQVERRDDIIRKSLQEAVVHLESTLGRDTRMWRWGDAHTVTLKHPFGLVPPLGTIFNIGPFPYRGGPTALLSGEYSYNEPFAVTVGASFRQIVDMAHPEKAYRVLPTGQSGQVLHKHYDDQTQLWLNGGLRTVLVDTLMRSQALWDHLTLLPVQEGK